MELSNLSTKKKSNAGEFLHLINPKTFEPYCDVELDEDGNIISENRVGLILLGMDSDYAQKKKHERINAGLLKRSQKGKKSDEENFSEKSEAEQNEILADCTLGWENITYLGDPVFTRENIIKVYSDAGWSWIREQAIAFVGNRGNFLE